jgi:hypothetical protein
MIKRRIEVPSQCIHYDHTLPENWVSRAHREFVQQQPQLARRIRQRYELCIWNLLLKHHWVPFAPRVHAELRGRGWVSDKSVWTAVEVMKQAEDWRLLRCTTGVTNPLVAQCVWPFVDDSLALVSTTGVPYLSQGTASPLKTKVVDIHGRADREDVVYDVVWEADMCFTKPDIGMSLPWVLHVADTGALQLARSYKISGITA